MTFVQNVPEPTEIEKEKITERKRILDNDAQLNNSKKFEIEAFSIEQAQKDPSLQWQPNITESLENVAGRIHKKEFRQFWERELEADKWVMHVIKEGYKIPFSEEPHEYMEPNNQSAKRNINFVRKTLAEWESAGIIERLSEKPKCVSPLSVATRTFYDGSEKMRLCWDGSRYVNRIIKKESVQLNDLTAVLNLIEHNEFLHTFDLKSAYFHISIHKDYRKYLGIALEDEEGKTIFYQFCVLPFGLTTAVKVITRLTKPLVIYLAKKGTKFSIYIDDGLSTGNSKEDAARKGTFAVKTFQKAGFVVSSEKSDNAETVSTVKVYLGMEINTQTMTLRLPESKARRMIQELQNLQENYYLQPVYVRQVASVLGLVVSAEKALPPSVHIRIREPYRQLQEAVEAKGWNSKMTLNVYAFQQLLQVQKVIVQNKGYPIRTSNTAIEIRHIVTSNDPKTTGAIPNQWCGRHSSIVVSDASETGCSTILREDNTFFAQHVCFDDEEKVKSSSFRELLAVKHLLQPLIQYLKTKLPDEEIQTLYWATDSKNLVTFLTKGSCKQHINDEIIKIHDMLLFYQWQIQPLWLSREHEWLQDADYLSRCELDDWSIDKECQEFIFEKFGKPAIDLFASRHNKITDKYYSKQFEEEAEAVDAFSQYWGTKYVWACPPTNLIIQVTRKIIAEKAKAILLVPDWPSKPFWSFLFGHNGQARTAAKTLVVFPHVNYWSGRKAYPFAKNTTTKFHVLLFSKLRADE